MSAFLHTIAGLAPAAPRAGGARFCGGLGALILVAAQVAAGQGVPPVPSGLEIALVERFVEDKPDGMHVYARFRFLAPQMAGGEVPDFEVLARDFELLCNDFALPMMRSEGATADRIVISYSDRPVAFGEPDPDARQFFEQFRIENGACMWENF